MPKNTFYRLPKEKKDRILNAARDEFKKVTFEDASINQIIKNAEISRGSFYQYFEDKKDIFMYVLSEEQGKLAYLVRDAILGVEGDLFGFLYVCIKHFETFLENEQHEGVCSSFTEEDTFRMIVGMLRETRFCENIKRDLQEFLIQYIDFSLFRLDDEQDRADILSIIGSVIKDSMQQLIQCRSKEEAFAVCGDLKRKLGFLERNYRK